MIPAYFMRSFSGGSREARRQPEEDARRQMPDDSPEKREDSLPTDLSAIALVTVKAPEAKAGCQTTDAKC